MRIVAWESTVAIGGRSVGGEAPLFVVAEIGLNHGGDLARALAMVDAAARAGASAVKLQSLRAASLVAPQCPPPAHVRAASLREFFAPFELDDDAHRALAHRAREAGVAFLSTPFDEQAIAMLVGAGIDALKIASGDITHHRLIAAASRTGLPVVLSTGMSDLREVAAAVNCAREHGALGLALLHCVSAYPVPSGSENLAAIRTLADTFGVPVGLSDHAPDIDSVAPAVALGASIYERHFVLQGDDQAIDRAVSSTPMQLADIVLTAERTRRALGHGRRECLPAEAMNRARSRRGLYVCRPMSAGEILTEADLICLRPESEIPATDWRSVVGARLLADLPAGAPVSPKAIETIERADTDVADGVYPASRASAGGVW